MRRLSAVACAVMAVLWLIPGAAHADTVVTLVNSDSAGHQLSRFDTGGNALDAHDGSLLQVGDLYYLYGTSYSCGYTYNAGPNASGFCGFKAYSSPDLVHWTDRGYIVAPGQCRYCFRPHVIYNQSTATYVMWADMGLGSSYGVFTSPAPTGLFTRRANPALAVGGAVDAALFADSDGSAYVIHNTTIVGAGLTADMVVERLTPDYLNTTGQYVRLGLGNVEAFAAFKRDGVYHVLMSDPTCAYCAGSTGEVTATSMLGPWSGIWYDPNGVDINNNRPQPRNRSRIVNADNCGGQPLAVLPITRTGGTDHLFVADRWVANLPAGSNPNQSLANFHLGPLTFGATGTLQSFTCASTATVTLPGTPVGGYNASPDRDQHSGFAGFRHYCDISGDVWRQQSFTPSRTGLLTSVAVTTFQRDQPTLPLTVDIVDTATGALLQSSPLAPATVGWAPSVLAVHPNVAVTAGHSYTARLHTASTQGCYGFEYHDANPYPGGSESYSTDGGGGFTGETARDLKFTTDVNTAGAYVPEGLPAGYTYCAGEGGTCTFTGTRSVAYGAGGYRYVTATGTTPCGIVAFGGDPAVGVLKSCYLAPAGGPSGYTSCAGEGGTCSFTGTRTVAYGSAGSFAYRVASGTTACGVAAFGRDPLPGVLKSCYLAGPGAPAGGWQQCAAEGGTCAVSGPTTVMYGNQGSFHTRQASAPVPCTASGFGGTPPGDGAKACYVATGGPAGYGAACAAENGTCAFTGFRTVAYGAAGRFTYRSLSAGTACTNTAFGLDPVYGTAKNCYLAP
ncbi:family 43 glycosylhydrolase [Catellatospora methionotrophica]|uniref:family 43 glycosylhydrolase n=1 Tax=Catellatospora methionotrophica TaxID=121620 RepID=UPI003403C16A